METEEKLFAPADEMRLFCNFIDTLQDPVLSARRFTLWDLDNCLADDSWRVPRIDWNLTGNERYARYNEYANLDKVRNLDVFAAFQRTAFPIFLSGRPEHMRAKSLEWMGEKLNLQVPTLLLMRPDDCAMKPAELKQEMLWQLFGLIPRIRIAGAFDDMEPIVRMYRANKVPASRLFIHEGYAAYAPSDLAPASTP